MILTTDTIVARATPPGKGGVGIIRISGPQAKHIAETILGFIPKTRYAHYCPFKEGNETIDEGIALFFEGPNSFTGEDVLELQGHGGPVILDELVRVILLHGPRLARPGEFSERAFLNNKMDLTQAEAVADLINADSVTAAKCAVRSLQGEFSQKISTLIEQLIHLRKMVEAAIDFPEEEIDFLADGQILQLLQALYQQLQTVLSTAKQGALLQEGMTVVIAGEPNAGKSSLLNSLSGKESAIVTDIAGTTRDVLREHIHIDGMPLHIIDTAGLRETNDVVEQEGVKRARAAIHSADIIVFVIDGSKNINIQQDVARTCKEYAIPNDIPVVVVENKIDLTGKSPDKIQQEAFTLIQLSAKQQQGLDILKSFLMHQMGFEQQQEGVFIARRRHIEALKIANNLIEHGLDQLQQHKAGELLAEDLRLAQVALSEITGEYSSDDLLGEIFSSFCIGK